MDTSASTLLFWARLRWRLSSMRVDIGKIDEGIVAMRPCPDATLESGGNCQRLAERCGHAATEITRRAFRLGLSLMSAPQIQ